MAAPEMTVAEFAARLKIGVTAAKTKVANGEIDVINVGSILRPRLRITEAAYQRYIKSREIRGRRSVA